jgi:hypothetical protein
VAGAPELDDELEALEPLDEPEAPVPVVALGEVVCPPVAAVVVEALAPPDPVALVRRGTSSVPW